MQEQPESSLRTPAEALSSTNMNENGSAGSFVSEQKAPNDVIANYALERHRRLEQRSGIFGLVILICLLLYLYFIYILLNIESYWCALKASPYLALTIGLLGVLPTIMLCGLIKGIYAIQTDALEEKKDKELVDKITEVIVKTVGKTQQ